MKLIRSFIKGLFDRETSESVGKATAKMVGLFYMPALLLVAGFFVYQMADVQRTTGRIEGLSEISDLREEVGRLEGELIAAQKLSDQASDCGVQLAHIRGYLQAIEFLAERESEQQLMQVLQEVVQQYPVVSGGSQGR